MALTIILFVAIIGILVFIHEAGHFFAARKAGIRVDEFGFGLPPRVWGLRRGETIYSLNWIPFGGFVKIFGEGGEGKEDTRSFSSKSAFVRIAILLAGVTVNWVFAALLLGAVHMLGIPTAIPESDPQAAAAKIQLIAVSSDSPADEAGLEIGDTIVALRYGEEALDPLSITAIQDFVRVHAGNEILMTVVRGNDTMEKRIVPRVQPPENEGPLGISLTRVIVIAYPWYEAPWRGVVTAFSLTGTLAVGIWDIFKNLISSGTVSEEVAGPIGIASLTGNVRALGITYVIQFIALLSLNLALLNSLPIPALDGGRALFVLIEKIIGRPVSLRAERLMHNVGFVLLLLFLFWISYRDLERLF